MVHNREIKNLSNRSLCDPIGTKNKIKADRLILSGKPDVEDNIRDKFEAK